MTTVTGLTKGKMLALSGAYVIQGEVDQFGHLILERADGSTHDAGLVSVGPTGPQGATGETGPTGDEGPQGDVGPKGADSFVPGPRGLQGPPNAVPARPYTAAHTLILDDAYSALEVTSESETPITIPPITTVPFPIGCVLEILQAGNGRVLLVAGTDVELQEPEGNLRSRKQYSTLALRQRSPNVWIVSGDTAGETDESTTP